MVTGVNSSWSGTSLTLPSITTASNNAMLIGAVGLDSGTPLAAPPSGWTQEWQAGGGQVAALADKVQPTAGASGPATWTLSSGRAARWMANRTQTERVTVAGPVRGPASTPQAAAAARVTRRLP